MLTPPKYFSDTDLLARLTTFEDGFVERKLFSDTGDWLKTAVAFANSLPVGTAGVMFVGVKNNGSIEARKDAEDLESVQRKVMKRIAEAYPPIPAFPKILEKNGKQFIAVIIPASENPPHFAGQSYVRSGSDSMPASEQEFDRLIARRNSTAAKILEWIGKEVTILLIRTNDMNPISRKGRTIKDCNQYWMELENGECHPLENIKNSFDRQNGRLELHVLI